MEWQRWEKERHEHILLDLAKKRGYHVGAIYKEVVSGETISARPVMQKLLKEVEAGMWDAVPDQDILFLVDLQQGGGR